MFKTHLRIRVPKGKAAREAQLKTFMTIYRRHRAGGVAGVVTDLAWILDQLEVVAWD